MKIPKKLPKFYKVLIRKGKKLRSPGVAHNHLASATWIPGKWNRAVKRGRVICCTASALHVTTAKGLGYWMYWSHANNGSIEVWNAEVKFLDEWSLDCSERTTSRAKWGFRSVRITTQVTGAELRKLLLG